MQILHLEDSSADSEFIRHLLTRKWPECKIRTVARREEFIPQVEGGTFDLILSDYTLPSFAGLEALQLAKQYQPNTPFIFCSGTIGEDRAIEAIRNGATDYVLKNNLNRLVPAIQRALQESEEKRNRSKAEAALLRSERRHRALINATAEIVWSSNANGSEVDSEPKWHEFTGVPENIIQNEGWINTLHPDDRTKVTQDWTEALADKKPYQTEFRVRRADGAWRYMVSRAVPQFCDNGRIEEWVGICFDITAQKEAEHSERRLLALLEKTTDFVVVTSSNGELLYANPSSRQVLGIARSTPEQPRFLQDSYAPSSRERFLREFMAKAERDGSWSGETELCGKEEQFIPISQVLICQKTSDGKTAHFATIMRDITAIRESERKLREQAEVIMQARDAVIITDLTGIVTFWNQGAERLYGWPEADVTGRNAQDFFESFVVDQLKVLSSETLEKGAWSGEIKMHDRDRKTLYVEARASLFRDEKGIPKAFLNIVTDITDKKNLEEQFLRAQRMENLGLLASGIAHDLNNILTPILLAGPLLQSRLSDEDDIRLIQTLDQSAQRGAEMVKQILSFARGAGGDFRLIQVRHLLSDVIRISESTFPKTIELRYLASAELSVVRANPTQMHQLLLNLFVNARDAMPNGGVLWLRAENRTLKDPTPLSSGLAPKGSYVMIEVSDSGTGIPPEVLTRMWEPFFTTKEGKGTGLGLSTVRGIVQDHHGFIDVHTELGKGTTFRIHLPAVSQVEIKKGTSSPFVPAPGGNEMILVVDDEASLRAIIGATLSARGYHPIVASSATDAIHQASRHRHSIRLLITDLSMPDIDGNKIARLVREFIPEIKIIAMSGHADAEHPGDRFLVKPFKPDLLLKVVHEVLQTSPAP